MAQPLRSLRPQIKNAPLVVPTRRVRFVRVEVIKASLLIRTTAVHYIISSNIRPLWVKSRHSSAPAQCPLYPQKRAWLGRVTMSALCQKRTSAGFRLALPLRAESGLVFCHCNNGAGERAVGLSQLIQNREVIGVSDRYQVAGDMPLRPVGMVIAAARDHCRQL